MSEADNGDKQFDPTPQRREQYRKEGRFPRARDAGGIATTAAVLAVLLGSRGVLSHAATLLFTGTHGDLGALGRIGGERVLSMIGGTLLAMAAPSAIAAAFAAGLIGLAQTRLETREDLIEFTDGVNSLEFIVVVVQQWCRLGTVDLHPVTDDIFGVVCAAASFEPFHEFVLGYPEFEHRVQFEVAAFQHVVQSLRLFDRAGEAVEDEAPGHIRIVEAIVDQRVGQTGGHQVTGIQILLGLQTQRGAGADVVPEQISGRDLRNAEIGSQLDRLGSLARTRRTQQNDPHLRNPS
jgi:hypothetical protein